MHLFTIFIFLLLLFFNAVQADPQIQIDDDENAVAVWVSTENNVSVIQSALKLSGKSWKFSKTLSNSNRKSMTPILTKNRGDKAITVLWLELNPQTKNNSLYGVKLKKNKEWTTPVQISKDNENVAQFNIRNNQKKNENGEVMATWSSIDNNGKTSTFSSSSTGFSNQWSTPSKIN